MIRGGLNFLLTGKPETLTGRTVYRFPVIGHTRCVVATELEAQIINPVRWVESIEYMLRMGVREFVEIGPGRSMSRLIADIRAATPFAN